MKIKLLLTKITENKKDSIVVLNINDYVIARVLENTDILKRLNIFDVNKYPKKSEYDVILSEHELKRFFGELFSMNKQIENIIDSQKDSHD